MRLKTFVAFLIVLCFSSWILGAKLFFQKYFVEIFLGMFPPLMLGIFSIYRIKSIFLNHPEKLTSYMIKAFVFKMIFYGIYIIWVIVFSAFNPLQFFVSFMIYFGTLHILEALFVRSVFKRSS